MNSPEKPESFEQGCVRMCSMARIGRGMGLETWSASMKVRTLMSTDIETCQPTTSLTDAALIMWRRDCGVVPVVDPADGSPVGIITDRDICIATATRHQSPDEIEVRQVMADKMFTCRPDEDVHDALATMRRNKVRRLPVVDARGALAGLLSLNDVVRRAEPAGKKGATGVANEEVVGAFKAVCERRLDAAAAARLPEPATAAVASGV
jgi:CBS domain-containing protein